MRVLWCVPVMTRTLPIDRAQSGERRAAAQRGQSPALALAQPRCSDKGLKVGIPNACRSKSYGAAMGKYSGLSGLFAIATDTPQHQRKRPQHPRGEVGRERMEERRRGGGKTRIWTRIAVQDGGGWGGGWRGVPDLKRPAVGFEPRRFG